MAGDTKEIGEVELVGPEKPHEEIVSGLENVKRSTNSVADILRMVGSQIIQVDANGSDSQHPKLRIRYLVFSAKTAGDATLDIGSRSYPFTLPAEPVVIPFPILIERGVSIGFTASDGRVYLVGDTE